MTRRNLRPTRHLPAETRSQNTHVKLRTIANGHPDRRSRSVRRVRQMDNKFRSAT